MNLHVGKVKKSVGNKLFKLGKMRKYLGEKDCLLVYKSMIVPVMDYCSFYLGGAQQNELQKLQRLQNRAIRICCQLRIRGNHIDDMHNDNKIHMLEKRRKQQLLCFMWKRSKTDRVRHIDNVRTRGDRKIKFLIRRACTSFYQKGPFYRRVSLWDRLSEAVQKSTTQVIFKNAITAPFEDQRLSVTFPTMLVLYLIVITPSPSHPPPHPHYVVMLITCI